MKKVAACILVIAFLAGSGPIELQSAIAAPNVDIWMAAAEGNIEAIKEHLAAGADINAKAPSTGLTPLMAASIVGQSDAA